MSDKIAKLEVATDEAKKRMDSTKEAFDDSLRRLEAAKELLREMSPEDQQKIQVNDTKLPELLEMHSMATEAYEEAKKRYETNSRYLELFKAKLG
eukprot:CAMPEP_0204611948 /NCGR_PEP_ID=MMETSP0717-20131115/63_1 /ASSEMBLY_ACC=CAM_ASM_000666 /TAXON_ID=230516 /ORGANISM="Chaetoceros curvisetus" /LENGTH=94 /DNA_ID=CAMNT_0051623825 /DNA_START=471 /DNA_END=755 /DNA_ORIENTATION=+